MVLDFITGYTFEPLDLLVVLTLIFLEGVLSFDNAAVLAAMVRKLPVENRRKALLYGLVGAYVMRVGAILLAATIIANPVLKVAGGAYLVYLTLKHFRSHAAPDKVPTIPRILGMGAFWSTVVMVELADLAFALDQVLVAVAYTDKVLLVVVAALFAILILRLSAYYMTRLMDWFPGLEHIAYAVVGFVGVKLIASYWGHELPKSVTIPITLGAFVVPVAWKWLSDRGKPPAEKPRTEAMAEEGGSLPRQ